MMVSSFLNFILPLSLRSKRQPLVIMALLFLMSMNIMMVQFQMMVLAGETTLSRQTAPLHSSLSLSPSSLLAWVGIRKKRLSLKQQQKAALPGRPLDYVQRPATQSSSRSRHCALRSLLMEEDESILPPSSKYYCGTRRNFVVRSTATTTTTASMIIAATSFVQLFASGVDPALATNSSSTSGEVDWDAFGSQLQRQSSPSSLTPSSSSSTDPSTTTTSTSSDLEKALQESAQRKSINPRTHG